MLRANSALGARVLEWMAMGKRSAKPSAREVKRRARFTGAPSPWTPELADRLCRRIANGQGTVAACRAVGLQPNTVWEWLTKPEHEAEGFVQLWAAANAARLELAVDQLMDLVREVQPDAGHVAKARLRVQVVQWLAERLLRRKYGPSVTLAGDPEAPVVLTLARTRIEERLAEIAGEVPPEPSADDMHAAALLGSGDGSEQ